MSSTRRHKRRAWLQSLAPFALFAVWGACGAPQSPEQPGAALVAIHGAEQSSRVRVDGSDRGTIARTNGAYLVEAGERRLEVITEGHLPFLLDLSLRGGETYDVTVQLWPCFPEVDEGCWPEPAGVLEQLPGGGL